MLLFSSASVPENTKYTVSGTPTGHFTLKLTKPETFCKNVATGMFF